jgi:4-amino-4-deoxy-L-arabinose transferase-like glycosyltransferase
VAILLGIVAVVRLGYLGGALYPDEAGYLLIARAWHLGGPNLYGYYFVDRPPGLLLLFKVASLLPGDQVIRVLTIPFAMLFVAAAAWAAHQLVGPQGARWAAVAGAAFALNPVLGAQEADGEIFAAPLVMLAVALTVAAVRRTGRRAFGFALLAGLTGGLAVMVKQNFVDAFVFGAVLVVASAVQGRLSVRDAARVIAGGVAGGSVVLLGALGYLLAARVGVATAWFSLVGFRGGALAVISDSSLHAPLLRAVTLVGLAALSGMLPIAALLAREAWRCHFTGPPVAWAVTVTLVVGVVAIVLGGSFWPHYLLQLAPMLALAAGLWAPQLRWLQATTVAAAGCAAVVAVAAVVGGVTDARTAGRGTGEWVRASSRAGDTATVLYGHAEVQYASGDPSPYPFLWSLPMRTIDPHLSRLRALLSGRNRPDWVVVWSGTDVWNIDPRDRTRLALATHYRPVGRVCGHEVWLRDGVARRLAPAPAC